MIRAQQRIKFKRRCLDKKNQWVQHPSPAFIQVDRWSIWSHCHWHWPEKGNQWLGLSAGQCTLLRVKDDVSASLWRLFSKSKPQEAKLAAMASPYRRIKLHVGKQSPRVWQVLLDSRQKDAETSSFRHRSVDRPVLLDHFTFKSAVSGTYLQRDIFRESKLLSTGAGFYPWTTPVENVASEKGHKKTRSAWNLSCFTYFWIYFEFGQNVYIAYVWIHITLFCNTALNRLFKCWRTQSWRLKAHPNHQMFFQRHFNIWLHDQSQKNQVSPFWDDVD